MPGLLHLPLEIRNYVYEILLHDALEPQIRGVMVVSDTYIRDHLPMRPYRGLLRTCRQINREFKQAIRHMAASKRLDYELDITFSHGRPFFSLTWKRFPALSPLVNSVLFNIDLRVRDPFRDGFSDDSVPHDHELAHLLEDPKKSFAGSLFDYAAILFKAISNLLVSGDPAFRVLYMETLVLNFRTPTMLVPGLAHLATPSRRVNVEPEEAKKLLDTMRGTLQANVKAFKGFEAAECRNLFPLIQIGRLRFATEGVVWGEGHNMILAHDDFQWLRY
ncbi:unnamed protein product [Periconia digitata]|uniref:Uncharacterized protein n=1 Tax=Periconia digitata TaxID=1303443 RepID=A0A9W4U8U8_9PLEO|nr:unnamed protein product [Periconia digitata]